MQKKVNYQLQQLDGQEQMAKQQKLLITSVILNSVPDYANMKYYLGISLAKIGQYELAKKAFEDIKKTNPEAKELDEIIKSVTANKDPFPEVTEPVKKAVPDTKPVTGKKK